LTLTGRRKVDRDVADVRGRDRGQDVRRWSVSSQTMSGDWSGGRNRNSKEALSVRAVVKIA
jgi:hypothetical protein